MGEPSRYISKTARAILTGEVDLPELTRNDLLKVVTEIIKSLKRLGRSVSYPTVESVLQSGSVSFSADMWGEELRETRALLLYHYWSDQKYMLDERGNIFTVYLEYTNQVYRRQNVSIEIFVDAISQDGTRLPLDRLLLFVRDGLADLTARLDAQKRAVDRRATTIDTMISNLSKIKEKRPAAEQ